LQLIHPSFLQPSGKRQLLRPVSGYPAVVVTNVNIVKKPQTQVLAGYRCHPWKGAVENDP